MKHRQRTCELKILKKKEEKGKIKKNVEIPERSTKCVCCSRSMKSYWGCFRGRVCCKAFVLFQTHQGTVHMSTCCGQRERQREKQRERHIYGGVGQALRLEIGEIKLLENLASACVADTAAPIRMTHGLRLAARKAHREC